MSRIYSEQAHIKPGYGSPHPEGVPTLHVARGESRGIQFEGDNRPLVTRDGSIEVQVRQMHPHYISTTGDWYDFIDRSLGGAAAQEEAGAWWIDLEFNEAGEFEIIIDGQHAVQAVVYDARLPLFPYLTMTLGTNMTSPTVSDAARARIEDFGPQYVGPAGWTKWTEDVNTFVQKMRCSPYQPHNHQWFLGHNPAPFYDGMGPLFDNPPGVVDLPSEVQQELNKFRLVLWWNLSHTNTHKYMNQMRLGGVPVTGMSVQEASRYFEALAKYEEELSIAFGHPIELWPNMDEPGDPNAYNYTDNPGTFERLVTLAQGGKMGGRPISCTHYDIRSMPKHFGPYFQDYVDGAGQILFSQGENKIPLTREQFEEYASYGVRLQNYLVYHGSVAVDGVNINTRKNMQCEKNAWDHILHCYTDNIDRSLYWSVKGLSPAHWQKQTYWIDPLGMSARFFRYRSAVNMYDLLKMAEHHVGRTVVIYNLETNWKGWSYEDIRGALLSIITNQQPTEPTPPPPLDVTGRYLRSVSTDVEGGVHLSWDEVPGANRYTIWRNTQPDGTGTWSPTRDIRATQYVDTEVIPLKSYLYRVDALSDDDAKRMTPDRVGMALPIDDEPAEPDPPVTEPEQPPSNYEAQMLAAMDKVNDQLAQMSQDLSDLADHLGSE